MRTIWKVSLYHVSSKTGFKVRIEGDPHPGKPWVISSGTGKTTTAALKAALDQMAQSDQDIFSAFLIDPHAAPSPITKEK